MTAAGVTGSGGGSAGTGSSGARRGVARARWAISAQFFTNGVLGGSLLPRLPEIKAAYELSDTAYGFAVVSLPLGAVLAAAAAGPIIRRFGALRVAATGTVVFAWLLALAGFSPVVGLFVAALLLAGVSDTILDTAQNVQGMAVERWNGKSIINSMHAAWSLGATVGGFIGAASAAAGVSIGIQMTVGAAVWSVVAVVAAVMGAVPAEFERAPNSGDGPLDGTGGSGDGSRVGPRENPSGSSRVSLLGRLRGFPWLLFVPLMILSIVGSLVEDVANNWATLFLSRDLGAEIGLAGTGFALALGAQFIGRITGDPMADRWGRNAVARNGGLLIALGGVLAVFATVPWLAILGFAMAGFGSATLIPAAYAASDSLPGVPHGTGVAMLSWALRVGFLMTSPMVGMIADLAGLRFALSLLVVGGLVAAALSQSMQRREAAAQTE